MEKIRIVIIEDNKLLRDGIKAIFKAKDGFLVVAALGDKINVFTEIERLKPDLLLLDLGLVNQNSLELVKNIKKKLPRLKMVVMDFLPIQSDIKQFVEEGVTGFLLKDATTEVFMNTLRSVAKGDKVFPSQLHGSLVTEIVDDAVNELMDSKLIVSIRMTEIEKKIIDFISKGLSDDEIGEKLSIDVDIVRSNINNILEKMSLSNRVQIAVYKNSGEDGAGPLFNKTKKPKK